MKQQKRQPVEMVDLGIRTFPETMEYLADRYSDRCAFRFRDRDSMDVLVEKTYRNMKEQTLKMACQWETIKREEGFEGSVKVAFLGSISYEYMAAFFSVVGISDTAVLIDVQLPIQDIMYQIKHSESVILLYDEKNREKAEKLQEQYEASLILYSLTDLYRIASKREPSELSWREIGEKYSVCEDTAATLLYTSGTTGKSKGVILTHGNYIWEMQFALYSGVFGENDVVLNPLPVNHVFSLAAINLGALMNGCCLCLCESVSMLLQDMKFFRPTCLSGVPMMYDILLRKIKEAVKQKKKTMVVKGAVFATQLLPISDAAVRSVFHEIMEEFGGNLKHLICGGASMNPDSVKALEELGFLFKVGYGLTETTGGVTHYWGADSVGKAPKEIELRIVDGEIQVKAPVVTPGYYKDPEATKEAFTRDGFFRTGDLGYFNKAGNLVITGRLKNLIILANGENISPEKIETELLGIANIKEAVVYEENGHLAVEIYAERSCPVREQIKKDIQLYNESRPAYFRLVKISFRDREFEKTSTKKIKRCPLTDRIREAEEKEKYRPVSSIQKQLCEAFSVLLGTHGFLINDNFFLSGGDSISALEAAARNYDGFSFTVQELYEYPTVLELERHIIEKKESGLRVKSRINERISAQQKVGGIYKKPEHILLTGANGYLGVHILRELIHRKVSVACMIRNEEKLKRSYRYYFNSEIPKNVRMIRGDIRKERFDMSSEEYKILLLEIDTVIHVAAIVKHAGLYPAFHETNVEGTKRVIEFCREAGAVLHHTSTVSIHGSGVAGFYQEEGENAEEPVFTEKVLDIGQKYEDNVYIRSKYEAEEAVISARDSGLSANIYRIGNLTWRYSDGKFQINPEENGFRGRMLAIAKVREISDMMNEYPMDLTPVDECAAAYVTLVFAGISGQIYHLYHPTVFTAEELLRRVHVTYHKVSDDRLMADLMLKAEDRDITVLLFYLKMSILSKSVSVRNTETLAALQREGFLWKKMNTRYLGRIRKLL